MKDITAFIDNQWVPSEGSPLTVVDKFSGDAIAELRETSSNEVDRAIASARRAFEAGPLPLADRIAVLERAADGIAARKALFEDTVIAECGQTRAEAEKEVSRAILTLKVTAEEAKRLEEHMVPFEGMPGGAGKLGYLRRHPLGVVCAITAFNSPLNTPVHKIGPALAAGNAIVMKAPSVTPISTAILCEVFAEAGLPEGWLVSVVGGGRTVGEQLLNDERLDFYHFTGSTAVGKHIASTIGLRRSSLELGSIAATIVCDDADVEKAAADIVRASFAKAGQVCTSTQIVYAERGVSGDLLSQVAERAKALQAGDPRDPKTNLGPLISENDAERVMAWTMSAKDDGAQLHLAPELSRSVLSPAVLSNVAPTSDLIAKEVFGPVVSFVEVSSVDEAIASYNAHPYGLAAGVFTNSIDKAFKVTETLRAGTVHVNSASSSRLDPMPFGGVRDSGFGKEGPKYAIEEMTEERLCLWHGVK